MPGPLGAKLADDDPLVADQHRDRRADRPPGHAVAVGVELDAGDCLAPTPRAGHPLFPSLPHNGEGGAPGGRRGSNPAAGGLAETAQGHGAGFHLAVADGEDHRDLGQRVLADLVVDLLVAQVALGA